MSIIRPECSFDVHVCRAVIIFLKIRCIFFCNKHIASYIVKILNSSRTAWTREAISCHFHICYINRKNTYIHHRIFGQVSFIALGELCSRTLRKLLKISFPTNIINKNYLSIRSFSLSKHTVYNYFLSDSGFMIHHYYFVNVILYVSISYFITLSVLL